MLTQLARNITVATLLAIISLLSGCAVNRATATVDPSANLGSIKAIHVIKFGPDNKSIDSLIADKIRSMGLTATTGEIPAANSDAVITYIDKWMWDITMYMIELTIQVRDPKDNFTLAVGNSYHTSLTRKSPAEMVDEVITNIFKGK
ncbi:MAG: hypothetical protein Q8M09_03090 [Pseudomonadota bacterium]|nr:hypothetical protein [Pseudomonadota bacterium]MDP1903220.1 hypothetical protein [Pseudomonadota bacterium]MDP2352729.1 hypothetical protein [Pseudomonadota bacterium]